MKNIEIFYVETIDSRFIITEVKNLVDVITSSFNGMNLTMFQKKEICRLYNEGTTVKNGCNNAIYVNGISFIVGETVFSKEEFTTVIGHFKAAGERLVDIKKAVLSYETKTITI